MKKVGQNVRPSIARFRDEDGGGFLAGIEIGHQLHCLVGRSICIPWTSIDGDVPQDLLRKQSYIEHYGPMDDNYVLRPEFYRVHLG